MDEVVVVDEFLVVDEVLVVVVIPLRLFTSEFIRDFPTKERIQRSSLAEVPGSNLSFRG